MVQLPFPLKYLAQLTPGKVALWCYLIWYLVTVVAHFDKSPAIWLSSLGISAIVGVGTVHRAGRRHRQALTPVPSRRSRWMHFQPSAWGFRVFACGQRPNDGHVEP